MSEFIRSAEFLPISDACLYPHTSLVISLECSPNHISIVSNFIESIFWPLRKKEKKKINAYMLQI